MSCPVSEEDPSTLRSRVESFLSDRSTGTVTGPRRMGRDELVDYVAGVAVTSGLSVSVVPGVESEHPEVLVFRHWHDVDEALVSAHPDADVLCGQDLCHQVPAVMRLNRRA